MKKRMLPPADTIAWWCASAAVVAFLLVTIWLYGTDMLHFERFDSITSIHTMLAGSFWKGIKQWIYQYPDHPDVLNAFISFSLIASTQWNMKVELFLAPTYVLICVALLWWLASVTLRGRSSTERGLLGLVLCILAFSPQYVEIWYRALHNSYLPLILFLLSLVILTREHKTWRQTLAAAACAFVATFSFGSGILVWVALVPMLFLGNENKHDTRRMLGIWALCFVLTAALFRYVVSVRFSQYIVLQNVPAIIRFALMTIGGSFAGMSAVTALIAGGAVAVVSGGSVLLLLLRRVDKRRWMPWACVSLFAFLTACAIAVGRVHLGIEYALSSRYTALGVFAVIAMMFLVQLSCATRRTRLTGLVIWAALGLAVLWAGIQRVPQLRADKLYFERAKACLEAYDVASDSCLGMLHWSGGAYVRQQMHLLEDIGFRRSFAIPAGAVFLSDPHRAFGAIESLSAGTGTALPFDSHVVAAVGWAAEADCRVPPRVVLTVGADHRLLALAATVSRRDDVALRYGDCYRQSGWEVPIDKRVLARSPGQPIEAWVADGLKMLKLDGDVRW